MKFYRAGRWSDAQILEEHAFALELAAAEIAVVAPLRLGESTLHHFGEFRLAAFPMCAWRRSRTGPGRGAGIAGAYAGRIQRWAPCAHSCSGWRCGRERLGARARVVVLGSGQLPEHMHQRYTQASAELLGYIEAAAIDAWSAIRLHGDCHLGNILWQAQGRCLSILMTA